MTVMYISHRGGEKITNTLAWSQASERSNLLAQPRFFFWLDHVMLKKKIKKNTYQTIKAYFISEKSKGSMCFSL